MDINYRFAVDYFKPAKYGVVPDMFGFNILRDINSIPGIIINGDY